MDTLSKSDYDVLPKIGPNRENTEMTTSNCIVPIIESKNEKQKDNINKKFNNCVPDDLILSLKQAEHPKEFLGPPTKRTLQTLSKNPSIIKRCDNAWNYEKQRERFKFLTDQPVCSCGAGNKSSQKSQVMSKYDASAIRASQHSIEKPIQIGDSLVPEEFRIVKNVGVWPLKVEDQHYSTMTEDHNSHLTVFPSLKPTGRNEVVQLKHTMDALLKRVGADIIDQKGPTQLHNLLEIIKQEQDIYNIIFYEVIRQVTVECKDRGEILSKLRERYANLLSRVPREIKSLHEEIIAQRALDRKLTEELMQFKTTIGYLTDELSHVKQHDKLISEQAAIYQKDLTSAVMEAQKNASMLNEYHAIYELQRKRLEKSIETLTDERELWIRASYSVALKITEENKLVTAKRLNLAEKLWSKLAKHFSLQISDRDIKDLAEIQKYTENWKELMDEIRNCLIENEKDSETNLEVFKKDIQNLRKVLVPSVIDKKGDFVGLPNENCIKNMASLVLNLSNLLTKEFEKFNGDFGLQNEDRIKQASRFMYLTVQLLDKMTGRHKDAKEEEKVKKYMKYKKLQGDLTNLQDQYRNRFSGDNGYSKNLVLLNRSFDFWLQKLQSLCQNDRENQKTELTSNESDWQSLLHAIDDWLEIIDTASVCVGSPLKNSVPQTDDPDDIENCEKNSLIGHEDLFNETNKWLGDICHHIDTNNACIIEEVSTIHTKMIHWIIQVLIRLAPDQEELSEEAKLSIYNSTDTIEVLTYRANDLMGHIETFTTFILDLAKMMVSEQAGDIQPEAIERNEKETKNINILQENCQEWIHAAKLLVNELNGDNYNDNPPSTMSQQDELQIDKGQDSNEQSGTSTLQRTQENLESDTNMDMSQEFDNKSLTDHTFGLNDTAEESGEVFQMAKHGESFEILADDTNTQRKFLENINFNDTNHLSEEELKTTAFNALKTIEKLQQELIETEERAQNAETSISDLDLKLKEAFEKIRFLEKKVSQQEKTSDDTEKKENNEPAKENNEEETKKETEQEFKNEEKPHEPTKEESP